MKLRFRLSAIPDYAQLPLVFVVIWNQTVYYGSKLLADGWPHHDLTTAFDRAAPFLPWTVSIYLTSCIFLDSLLPLLWQPGKANGLPFPVCGFSG